MFKWFKNKKQHQNDKTTNADQKTDEHKGIRYSSFEIRKMMKKEAKVLRDKNVCSLTNTEDNVINVKNVNKYYFYGNLATAVLKQINFEVKRGEFAVLYGKSGSGKSTLLNLISGLDRASDGDIIVLNKNLRCLNNYKLTKFRREHISFVFQSYNLLQNLSGYDNIQTGAYLQKDKSKLLDLEELMEEFEVQAIKDKLPSQMSGGQQQRISILRALVKNAEIIFADEPTGALDEKTSRIVLKIMRKINEKYGTTIIMVSHDPTVAELADRVVHIKNGIVSSVKINPNPKRL